MRYVWLPSLEQLAHVHAPEHVHIVLGARFEDGAGSLLRGAPCGHLSNQGALFVSYKVCPVQSQHTEALPQAV